MATQSTFITLNSGVGVNALPVRERPLGRFYDVGPRNIGMIELLAIIIGGPQQIEIAQQITSIYPNLANVLPKELARFSGVGKAKAAQIKAAIELGRRFMIRAPEEPLQINGVADAAYIFTPWIGRKERENFAILYLNTRNHVIDREILYTGTLDTSLVRTAEVFRGAIRRNCANIIVAHNHPSGDPTPSPEDLALTRRLVEAGKLLETNLLDHFIVTSTPMHYTSLRKDHSHLFTTHKA